MICESYPFQTQSACRLYIGLRRVSRSMTAAHRMNMKSLIDKDFCTRYHIHHHPYHKAEPASFRSLSPGSTDLSLYPPSTLEFCGFSAPFRLCNNEKHHHNKYRGKMHLRQYLKFLYDLQPLSCPNPLFSPFVPEIFL